MSKRSAEISVTSGDDKRQRLSDDDSEFLESEESEAFIEQFDGDVSKIDARTGTIYLITNLKTGKVYVGLTTQKPEVRWCQHKSSANNPKTHFHRSIRKHGWKNFKPEILAENVPFEELCDLEMYYIAFYDSFKNGYNSTKGGEGALGCYGPLKNHNVNGGGSISFDKTRNKWTVNGCNAENANYIGRYLTKDKAIEALKLYNESGERVPSEVSNPNIRKAGTGSVYFHKRPKRWIAKGPDKKHIGGYLTKEKAIEALELYNEKGECMPPILKIRKAGTGCVSFNKSNKKWVVKGPDTKHIGHYFTKEKAIEALKLYNEKGERMPSEVNNRKAGTGCVYFNKCNKKWMATIQGKCGKFIGLYLTKEKAIEALKLYNERGERMPSDKLKRKAARGSIRERFSETMGKRFRGELYINGKRYRTKTRASREAVEKDFMELRLAFSK